MSIAFIKPNFPGERRVALLPKDIESTQGASVFGRLVIEEGFGLHLNISDNDYRNVGCKIASRKDCFDCGHIFSLKLIHPADFHYLRERQKIIGWMHPLSTGRDFWKSIAKPKQIQIFDIDSARPRIFSSEHDPKIIKDIPPHFLWKNSYLAGIAAVEFGLKELQIALSDQTQICIFGTGHVSQGAFCQLSALGYKPRMFSRKNLSIFYASMQEYGLIVNGVEMEVDSQHLLSLSDVHSLSEDVAIIDAAADAGRAIEGTVCQTIESPVGSICGRKYVMVDNFPSLKHQEASEEISKIVSTVLLTKDYFSFNS